MRVSELLYSAREDWIAVCKCMILDPSRHHDIWSWLERLPLSSLHSVIMANASALVGIDANQFAMFIAARMQNKVVAILQNLEGNSHLEYTLLGALYQIVQYKEEDISLELTTDLLEKYLELMCKLQPECVIGHIQGSHGCRLNEALRIVQKLNHKDAEAAMLEKLGNYQDAFDILLKEFQDHLGLYCQNKVSENETIHAAVQLAGICRRSAGNLDWMPLVDTILQTHSNSNEKKVEQLSGKLLRIVLESLSGTTALSTVLEQILKHPLATSGTIGDIRQLLSGVLTHSRYEQTLVETTTRLVSLELHKALERSLRDAGKACASVSVICPICRHVLSQCADYIVLFNCGHGYHSTCLGEPRSCYKCLNSRGWAPLVTNITHTSRPFHENKQILPPEFMRKNDLSLKLAPPTLLPDLEGIF